MRDKILYSVMSLIFAFCLIWPIAVSYYAYEKIDMMLEITVIEKGRYPKRVYKVMVPQCVKCHRNGI